MNLYSITLKTGGGLIRFLVYLNYFSSYLES